MNDDVKEALKRFAAWIRQHADDPSVRVYLHNADDIEALLAHAEKAEARVREWETKAANWMASPEAQKRLDGYMELGAKCAALEERTEAAEFARDEATRRMIDLARENGDLAAALTGLLKAYDVSPFLVSESKGASWDSRPDAREAAQAWYVALVTLSRRKEGTAGDDSEVQRLRSELARVSEEMGLPSGVGPAPGELRRLLADDDARCGLDFTLRLLAESELLVSGYMRTPDGKVMHLSELSRMARALVAKEGT